MRNNLNKINIKQPLERFIKRGYATYDTDIIGIITIVASEIGLEKIFLLEENFKTYHEKNPELKQDDQICVEAKKQLDEYFAGNRKDFDLKLVIEGTPFQKKVWESLTRIPYGDTNSYADIANEINNPKAVRAVGGANKKNDLPIVIPCHRVIGKSGKLVGFLGDNISIQEKLLLHEQKYK